METIKYHNRYGRLLLLTLIATVFAELLSGSITLSRIIFLPGQFLVYGPAVILIREVSRRLNAGWPTILILGLCFGLLAEGLSLQSLFSPVFMGNNLGFGRALGVNWVWAVYMPLFHAFFSISTPIFLTETKYNNGASEPWAGKPLLYILGLILLLVLTGVHKTFIKIDHFNAPALYLIILAVLIVLLIFVALKQHSCVPQSSTWPENRPAYHHFLIWLTGLGASLLWFLGLATVFAGISIAPLIVLAAAPLIIAAFFLLLYYGNLLKIVCPKDRFFLVLGLIMGEMSFGYFGTAAVPLDHYGQMGLILIILLLMASLYRKLNRNSDGTESKR